MVTETTPSSYAPRLNHRTRDRGPDASLFNGTKPMGLVFPSHVHACLANDQVVFLDERADTYSALSPDLLSPFKRLLAGTATDEDAEAVAGPLLPTGLLTRTAATGDRLALANIDRPTVGRADEPTRLTFSSDLVKALFARWEWSFRAQWQRPDGYFPVLRRKKANLIRRLKTSPPLEAAVAHAKPMLDTRWLLPTHDKCLPWSMAMTRYLMNRDIPVDLIIGVKTKPFGAHAWVQYRGTVLSDVFDEVRPFTPIVLI
ncbi:lasso peptide biosynthesis B2 protein [Asticcacaulis sp. DW145]|uniref:lasso peptide biosynthesis B2 protein n=1 Tax=Asticcacaulis sp. DW145 TaxID=3095608 RepID=UPI0030920C30|nr:lasso peptide biosynthesis B2 protein [Asticcacaulis sp. DW145]